MQKALYSLLFGLFLSSSFSQDNSIFIKSNHKKLLIIKNGDTLKSNSRIFINTNPGMCDFEFGFENYESRQISILVEPFDSIIIYVDFVKNILDSLFYRNYVSGKNYYTKHQVFFVVEKMPEFPGGEVALLEYLKSSQQRIKDSLAISKGGSVFVQFEINKKGTVDVVRILKGVNSQLDMMVQNSIWEMPQWKPGTQRGKPVRVSFTKVLNF